MPIAETVPLRTRSLLYTVQAQASPRCGASDHGQPCYQHDISGATRYPTRRPRRAECPAAKRQARLLLDAEQLIVLRKALAAAWRPGLQVAGAESYSQVRDAH